MTAPMPTAEQEPAKAAPFVEADVTRVEAEVHSGNRSLDRPLRGILLVVISTVFLASSDAMAKYLTLRLPAIEIAWMRYVVFIAIMCPAVIAASPRRALRTTRPGLQLLRGVTLVGSSLLFMSALRVLPIAEATTTGFVSPIFVTILSVVLLREAVGLRRWLATLIGLIGVVIVVRPGTSAFQPGALLAIASALCWASSLVATRRIVGHDSSVTTMTYSALSGLIMLSALLPSVFVMPTAAELGLGACIGVAATSGHWLVVLAYRYGDASVLAPLAYVQVVWAAVLGYGVFGNVPDGWTFAGAAVIISSGLYIAHRERLRRAALLRTAMAGA
ncbi:MAG: DMT family transporter [Xanthobacteraceae bacterium]